MARMRSGFGSLSGAANPRVVYSSTAPVKPKYKDIWYDTTDFSQYYWNDTSWISIGLGAGAISSMITDDVTVINFKTGDPLLTKMAIGVVADKDGLDIPLLVLGAGDGEGNNRGYISKGTDGLQMYYIGNLAGGEVAGLKLTKDGVYSTHKIIVDADLGSEFTIDASHWNAKLEEAAIKTVVENGAKGWNIAKANIDDTTTGIWDDGGSEAGATTAAAQAIIDLASDLQLDAALPTTITMNASGIKAETTGDATKYAILDYRGLYIHKGAITIENAAGTATMITGDGIKAEYIIGNVITGVTLQTGDTNEDRVIISDTGIDSYDNDNYIHGLQVDMDFADLSIYYRNNRMFKIEHNYLLGNSQMSFWDNIIGKGTASAWYALGAWDFGNATCTGLTAVFG